MAGNVKLMTSAGGGVILDTATTTATDVTVKVPVTGVNNGTLVCSDSSGNVGIGTSSFATGSKLAVQTASGKLDVRSYGGSSVKLSSSAALGYNSTGSNGHVWEIDDVQKMAIDSSGSLLVNITTNQPHGISARGTFVCRRNNSSYNIVTDTDLSGGTSAILFCNPNGAVGEIATNGYSTTYATSSDYRLKENIQPMQNALSTVAQLNPVTYTWKADGSDGQGFIAHELQAIVPDCVTGEKDAVDAEGNPVYQGIDTSFLVATLTKAIQELSTKNDALEARIATLEAK